MRTMKFEPESINNEVYSGHVELKVPHAREIALAYKTLKFKMDAQGNVIPSEDMADIMVGMIDIAEQFIVSAEILRKSDGKILTKEDIFYGREFQKLISEIGNVCLSGFTPSKK